MAGVTNCCSRPLKIAILLTAATAAQFLLPGASMTWSPHAMVVEADVHSHSPAGSGRRQSRVWVGLSAWNCTGVMPVAALIEEQVSPALVPQAAVQPEASGPGR